MNRLNEDDMVFVTLPNSVPNLPQASIACNVLAVVGRTIALEAIDKAITLRLPKIVDYSLISFRQGKRLVSLRGALLPDDVVPGDLRFVCSPNEGSRRTRQTRADVTLPGLLRHPETDRSADVTTVNLSLGGALLECSLDLQPEAIVEVEIRAGADGRSDPIVAPATVRRAGLGLVAVEFGALDGEQRQQIGKLVIEERRATRNRRDRHRAAVWEPEI